MPSLWPRKKWLKHLNLCMGSSPFLFFFSIIPFHEFLKKGFLVPRVRFRFFFLSFSWAPRSNCKNSRIELLKVQLLGSQHLRVATQGCNICPFKYGKLYSSRLPASCIMLMCMQICQNCSISRRKGFPRGPHNDPISISISPPRSVISISISRMLNINVSVGRLNLESCIAIRNSNAVSKFNEFMFVSFVSILERPYVICCPASVAYWISLFCKKKKWRNWK